MVAALHDGNSGVWGPTGKRQLELPVTFAWVQDQLLIAHVEKSARGVAPGDRVVRIAGIDLTEAEALAQSTIGSASEEHLRVRTAQWFQSCEDTDEVTLDVEPYAAPGSLKTIELVCGSERAWNPEPRPAGAIVELEPGIWYVNLHHVDGRVWEQAQSQLVAAKGIIFDVRDEDSVYMGVLPQLSDVEMQGERWCLPITWLPDQVDVQWRERPERLKPQAPRLRGRMAFLADGRNIGASETLMAFVEAYRLGEIVGTPTAGAMGVRNYFNMPGGYSASWTGYKVLKQDGSPRYGVGIQPTVAVARTRRGVAEGKDEMLLRAIDVVKGLRNSCTIVTCSNFGNLSALSGRKTALASFSRLTPAY